MHATAHVHQLTKTDSAKSYHKESIQSSSNTEGKEKNDPSVCTNQGSFLSSIYISISLFI